MSFILFDYFQHRLRETSQGVPKYLNLVETKTSPRLGH